MTEAGEPVYLAIATTSSFADPVVLGVFVSLEEAQRHVELYDPVVKWHGWEARGRGLTRAHGLGRRWEVAELVLGRALVG